MGGSKLPEAPGMASIYNRLVERGGPHSQLAAGQRRCLAGQQPPCGAQRRQLACRGILPLAAARCSPTTVICSLLPASLTVALENLSGARPARMVLAATHLQMERKEGLHGEGLRRLTSAGRGNRKNVCFQVLGSGSSRQLTVSSRKCTASWLTN